MLRWTQPKSPPKPDLSKEGRGSHLYLSSRPELHYWQLLAPTLSSSLPENLLAGYWEVNTSVELPCWYGRRGTSHKCCYRPQMQFLALLCRAMEFLISGLFLGFWPTDKGGCRRCLVVELFWCTNYFSLWAFCLFCFCDKVLYVALTGLELTEMYLPLLGLKASLPLPGSL